MATEVRGSPLGLIQELFAAPQRFEFCQVVWILEAAALRGNTGRPVGGDDPPEREAVRLRARPSLAFAHSEVYSLGAKSAEGPTIVETTFLGFVGTAGVMPQHYTSLALSRLQSRDSALRDFLDIFQHRALSLFYRASRKYRFPAAYLHAALSNGAEDAFTVALHSLIGLGQPGLRNRLANDDAALAFEGGHFARVARTATGLEQIVEDHFGVRARVEPFVGRWLLIPADERSRLLTRDRKSGVAAQLGRGVVLGSKAWDVQSKVRLHLGPVDSECYRHLARGGAGHRGLVDLVQSYVGPGLELELRITLEADAVGDVQLARTGDEGRTRLGRDGWLGKRTGGRALIGGFSA